MIGSLKRQRWPGGQQPWPDALKDSRAWAYLTMKPGEDPVAALASEFAALWFAGRAPTRSVSPAATSGRSFCARAGAGSPT